MTVSSRKTPALVAAALLLLVGCAAARQLDTAAKSNEHDGDDAMQSDGLHAHLSQPLRSLSWEHADAHDVAADGEQYAAERDNGGQRYNSYAHDGQYQRYSRDAAGDQGSDRSRDWSDNEQHQGSDQHGLRESQYHGHVYDRQRTQDGAFQGDSREAQGDESYVRGYDRQQQQDKPYVRGYDRQQQQDEPYVRGYDRQQQQDEAYVRGYDRQQQQDESYVRGYDRQQQQDEPYVRGYDRLSDRGYERSGERDKSYVSYNRVGERDESYRSYHAHDAGERGYVQYDSQTGRQYNDRDAEYRMEGEREQYDWHHGDAGRWQQERMEPYHAQHSHGSHAEGSTTANASVDSRPKGHCAQHHPSLEEKLNLQNLLNEAAEWWDEFTGEIEEWLEENGNVVFDWVEDNLSGVFSDTPGQNSTGRKKFSARIKVYWTAIVPNNGSVDGYNGKLSKKDVEAQIKVLNDAYKSAGFQFVLESFKSVKHTPAEFTACSEDEDPNSVKIKTRYRKGSATDLYIYTWLPQCATWSPLGWATFPEEYKKTPKLDGVVLLYTSLPGGKQTHYDQGITAVHEVGHWLGLYHTFGEGCGDEVNDEVDDTPIQMEETSGCPQPNPDTCPQEGLDPIHNYMDYSWDVCLTEFTKGQIKRMHNAWKLRVKLSKS